MTSKETANSLAAKYGTRDPFRLCEALNIIVLFEPLGTVRGYYSKSYRFKVIHINQNLPEQKQLFTCAHELGHALMHPNACTPFLREHTLFSVDKLEVEANRFAACLCYPADYLIQEFEGCSACCIAEALDLPLPLIDYTLGGNNHV